jgi:glycerol-3-phosphate dehydrogenase (NAD(P)+)
MTDVAVMGSGSWGTAFGMVLADAGSNVVLWGRETDVVEQVNTSHVNERYHPGITLPDRIRATADPVEAVTGAQLVILAVPAQTLRVNLAEWGPALRDDQLLFSLMKGIELGTMMRMSQVIAEVTGFAESRIGVVSGPNLAAEIARRQPAATTVACSDPDAAQFVQDACTTPYFRPYWTTDVVGSEIAGAVKNVIALANGMAVGLGYGENSQSALITRGLAEIARLGVAMGADPLTFMGLAGVGDLVATCSSPLSRNRTFGVNLGEGRTIDETIALTKQTCEGVKSCHPILDLATSLGVSMPITEQVVHVVHHGRKPLDMLVAFMTRETTGEAMSER